MKMITGINPKTHRRYKGGSPVVAGSTIMSLFIVLVIKGIATSSLIISRRSEILGNIVRLNSQYWDKQLREITLVLSSKGFIRPHLKCD